MKTIMAMVNGYGEVICELERDGDFFWRVPKDCGTDFNTLLCEGDVFRVEEIEVED